MELTGKHSNPSTLREFGYDPYNSADAWRVAFRCREFLLPPGLQGFNLVLLP